MKAKNYVPVPFFDSILFLSLLRRCINCWGLNWG